MTISAMVTPKDNKNAIAGRLGGKKRTTKSMIVTCKTCGGEIALVPEWVLKLASSIAGSRGKGASKRRTKLQCQKAAEVRWSLHTAKARAVKSSCSNSNG